MRRHFQKFSKSVEELQKLNCKSFVVEIGCNDGIMLENFVANNVPCLGIEPSENVANVAREKNIEIINEFFDEDLAKRIENKYKKADAILSANVMCHIPYIDSIFAGVKSLLK